MAGMSENKFFRMKIAALWGILTGSVVAFGAQLEYGPAYANPGDTVIVPLRLTGAENVAGFQLITLESPLIFNVVNIQFNDQILPPDSWQTGTSRLYNNAHKIVGFAKDLTGLADSPVRLADIYLEVDAATAPGVYPIQPTLPILGDARGDILACQVGAGFLTVTGYAAVFGFQSDTLKLSAQTQRLNINISILMPIAGFQFDIVDSADIFRGLSCQHSFGDNWDVNCMELENGAARVLALATDGVPLPDSSEVVPDTEYRLSIEIEINPDVQPGCYPVTLENLIVSDENAESISGDVENGTVLIEPEVAIPNSRKNLSPLDYKLYRNYPNPFNTQTTIRFDLPETAVVKLTIYNLLGQEVTTLVENRYPAGSYKFQWQGRNRAGNPVKSGIYFVVMQTGNRQWTREMILLK